MTDSHTPGLGSDNMSQADKDRIHSEGGKASHSNDTNQTSSSSTNNSGRGSNLTDADRAKGGHNSHSGNNG